MTVLEVGPGPGFLTLEASQRAGSSGRLYSLDIQRPMLEMIRRKPGYASASNLALIQGDASRLPFKDASFDLAFLVYVLGEIPDSEGALRELHRILKPGGVLSVSEVLFDPDYSTSGTIIKKCHRAGFEPLEKKGNFLEYTINFKKR